MSENAPCASVTKKKTVKTLVEVPQTECLYKGAQDNIPKTHSLTYFGPIEVLFVVWDFDCTLKCILL